MKCRKKADWPIIAGTILALQVLALAVYVGGYYAMGSAFRPAANCISRRYDSRWKAHIFGPAGRVEAALTGEKVVVFCPDELSP